MKKCCRCKIEKGTIDFIKDTRRKDGLRSECKECTKKYKNKYDKSFDGQGVSAYNRLKSRASPDWYKSQYYYGKGIKCDITREEFMGFWYSNRSIVEKIIEEGGKPSVDRIDSNGNYCLSNMRILSHRDNSSHKEQCSSKTKGVGFHTSSGKWQARAYHGGKTHCLGRHATEAEAAKAVELDVEKRGVPQH